MPQNAHIVNVACGASHTLCIDSNGDVYSFGNGAYGNLGHGNTMNRVRPTIIDALRGAGIQNIACGAKHSMVLDVRGQVSVFGYGGNGRLGNGENQGSLLPIPVELRLHNEVVDLDTENLTAFS